jgi:ssDNA-binding Zn-finger/Zn-ribbon topoisomerase 1
VQRTRTIKYSAGNFSSSFYALLGEKVLAPNIVSKTVSSRGVLEYDGFVYDISTNSPAPNFILSNKIVVHNSTRPAIIQKLYSRKYIIGNKSLEPSKVAFAVIGSLEKHSEIVTKPQMTAELEKEMDEIAAGKKTQKEVVQKSCDGLSQVMELLFKNKDAVGLELRMALRFSEIFGKCTCGANLVLRKSKIGKRFVGCSAYPDCTVTFPLPQTGFITPTSDYCPECRAPIIQVKAKRFHYKMCLNMTCVTKAEWAKKKEEKLKKEAEKKIVEEEKLKKAGEKGEDVKEKAVVQEGVEETDKELIPNVPVKESAAQALTEAITSIEPVSVKKVKDKLSLKKIKSTKTKSAKSKPSVSSSNTVKVKSK